MNKAYSWKNREFSSIDPAVAAESLEEIRSSRDGILKPGHVVEAAEDPEHPLHEAFPWDDSEAARIGRESIAARLIRSLKVTITAPKREPVTVRAFVSTSNERAEGGKSYADVVETMGDADGRAFILKQAWLQLKAWRKKYAALDELSNVLPLVDRVLKGIERAS